MGPGVTAVVATGLMRSGLGPDDPAVAKSLKYLEKFVQADGGIYFPKDMVQNYETSLAVVCFHEANRDHRYDKIVKNAEQFLKGIQWGGKDQPVDKGNLAEGGAGYGKKQAARPVEHPVLPRRPESGRRRAGRPGGASAPWSSSPAARTWRAKTTPRPSPPRTPTAASTTRRPPAATARPARPPTAACAATAR